MSLRFLAVIALLPAAAMWPGSAVAEPAPPAPKPDAASAAPAPVTPDASDARVRRLVADLGSEKFETREAAAAALVEIGPPAIPALREALERGDAEVKARAEAALRRIEENAPIEDRPPTPQEQAIIDKIHATKVTLEFQDQALSEILDFLAEFAHVEFRVDSEINPDEAKVTFRVQNLPLDAALKLITGSRGLGYVVRGGAVRIVRQEKIDAMKASAAKKAAAAAAKESGKPKPPDPEEEAIRKKRLPHFSSAFSRRSRMSPVSFPSVLPFAE